MPLRFTRRVSLIPGLRANFSDGARHEMPLGGER